MKKKLFLLILALTLLLSGCGQPYVYQVPEELDDSWETANLEEVGINGTVAPIPALAKPQANEPCTDLSRKVGTITTVAVQGSSPCEY
jgi:hypothetical protein